MTHALLLVDHGSRREEANAQLQKVAALVRGVAGADAIVAHAHMELAAPDVAAGFSACVAAGATHVVVVPYFLFAGRHATEDIPALAAAAARAHGISHEVSAPLGVHEAIARVVLERAGWPYPSDTEAEDEPSA